MLYPLSRVLRPNLFMYCLPRIKGNHSLYMICWYLAVRILRASWCIMKVRRYKETNSIVNLSRHSYIIYFLWFLASCIYMNQIHDFNHIFEWFLYYYLQISIPGIFAHHYHHHQQKYLELFYYAPSERLYVRLTDLEPRLLYHHQLSCKILPRIFSIFFTCFMIIRKFINYLSKAQSYKWIHCYC